MTLAIEVIYSEKDVNLCLKGNNHWTIKTKDDSLSALFEHTVAITKKGPIILTKDI
jgi:methionyl aminopeptidase